MKQCVSCLSDNISTIIDENRFYYLCKNCGGKNSRIIDNDGQIYTEKENGLIKHITIAALVKRNNQYLFINRSSFPFGICLPTTHLRYNETIEEALKMRVLQKTGYNIKTGKLILHETLTDPCKEGGEIHEWYVFKCDVEEDPAISSLSPLYWIKEGQIKNLDLILPAKVILSKIGLLEDVHVNSLNHKINTKTPEATANSIKESIIENLPLPIIVTDTKGKISFSNKTGLKLLESYKHNESLCEKLELSISAISKRAIESNSTISSNIKVGVNLFNIVGSPLVDNGNLCGSTITLKNVTDQKIKETQDILSYQTSFALCSKSNTATIISTILKQLIYSMEITSCNLMLLKDDSLKTNYYFSKTSSKRNKPKEFKLSQGVAGWVAKNKTLLAIPDTSKDPLFIGKSKAGERSLLSVPIISEGKLFGVLNATKKTNYYFSEEEMKMVTIVANRIALALENDNLYHQLEEKNDLLERVLNSTTDGIALVTKNLDMPYINNTFKKMFGFDSDKNPAFQDFATKSGEDNAAKLVKYFKKSLAIKKPVSIEMTLDSRLASRLEIIFNPIVEGKECENALVVANDITKLKNKQRTIQKHLDQFTTLFKISSLSVENEDEFYQNILRKTADLLQSKTADLFFFQKNNKDSNIKSLLDKEYRALCSSLDFKQKNNGFIINDVKRKISSPNIKNINRILCSPLKVNSRIIGWLTAANKKTQYTNEDFKLLAIIANRLSLRIETNRLFEKNRDDAEQIKYIIENTGDGLLVLSDKFEAVIYNKAMELITGFKAFDQYLSLNPDALVRLKQIVRFAKQNKKETIFREIRIKNSEGQDIWLDVTYSLITHGQNKTYIVAVMRDVSKEKALENQQKEFIYTATHELRTPLTAVKGYISMILDGDAGPISQKQLLYFNKAYKSAERLSTLVEDLLEVTRLEEGKVYFEKSPFSVNLLVKDVINDFRHKAKIKKLDLVSESPKNFYILGDYQKTKQALSNLVDNAIKYTPHGKITILIRENRNRILLAIKDNGVGISKKDSKNVFNKFFRSANGKTARVGGTGLGLFIVKNLIEKQGGEVWLESELGKGSTFYISMPQGDKVYTNELKNDKITISKGEK